MINIAIDGPSGAGKSTIAKEIAKRLGITYLDTGAMYRAIGLKALRSGVAADDASGVIGLLGDTEINITYDDGVQKIFLDGTDVSGEIREHSVSKAASDVSKIKEVREKLVAMQRDIASKKDTVLDGRDITSHVLKDTPYKFYLTADASERARRRYKELREKGQNVDQDKIYADIVDRDYNDMNRDHFPLVKTEDSLVVDSTGMDIAEVVDFIMEQIERIACERGDKL